MIFVPIRSLDHSLDHRIGTLDRNEEYLTKAFSGRSARHMGRPVGWGRQD